jgi:hypothetical protein
MLRRFTIAAAAAVLFSGTASAAAILAQTANNTGHQLQGSNYDNLRGLLLQNNTLTSTAVLDNPAFMNSFDALWVNDQTVAATANQISAIRSFIEGGKKAVILTDNQGWANWSNSLETMLDADITSACASATGAVLVNHALTAGVASLNGNSCDSLINPTPNAEILFSNNMVALYQLGAGEALLISSVNILNDNQINSNKVFAQNVVDWLGEPIDPADVPEPGSLSLLGLGLGALAARRRQRKQIC